MKGTLLACAASALLGSVAGHGERRHGHEEFHRMKRQAYASLVPANDTCTTIINTYYGEPTRECLPCGGKRTAAWMETDGLVQ